MHADSWVCSYAMYWAWKTISAQIDNKLLMLLMERKIFYMLLYAVLVQ
jgi:hypothetical protein